ncbi:hypothetical protein PHMEG_00015058 [Phytophthora megakarya]|uniref:Uncharacterized protein n=1 Tax=Phytophthora megakarya TaxID=4795 RepID=A0A225W2A4_9STRA|nr:hypothetical protein PHMEG_00015058 [Phytophthora megakarya]
MEILKTNEEIMIASVCYIEVNEHSLIQPRKFYELFKRNPSQYKENGSNHNATFPKANKGMQSFLGTLYYYIIFIQDFAVFGAALYEVKDECFGKEGDLSTARQNFEALKVKVSEAPIRRHFDQEKDVYSILFFKNGPGPLHCCKCMMGSITRNRSIGTITDIETCYTHLAGRILRVYKRFSTSEWLTKSKSLFEGEIQWARIQEKECAFSKLIKASVTNFVDITETLAP